MSSQWRWWITATEEEKWIILCCGDEGQGYRVETSTAENHRGVRRCEYAKLKMESIEVSDDANMPSSKSKANSDQADRPSSAPLALSGLQLLQAQRSHRKALEHGVASSG
jgi:hypothetical protein